MGKEEGERWWRGHVGKRSGVVFVLMIVDVVMVITAVTAVTAVMVVMVVVMGCGWWGQTRQAC